jgi:hypothetical protein
MQGEFSADSLYSEAVRLLYDPAARAAMRAGLAEVRHLLGAEAGQPPAPRRAAAIIHDILEGQVAHV